MVLIIWINILPSKVGAYNSPICSTTRLSAYYVLGTDYGIMDRAEIRIEKVS